MLSLISGLSTIIGGLITYIKIKREEEYTVIFLSISMFMMIFISIFDLLPKSIFNLIKEYNYCLGFILISLTLLLGYLTIFMINKRIKNDNSLYRIGILSMVALMIHNFPEGIAVFMSGYNNINIGIKLCIAIILHNIPEGFTIALPVFLAGKSRGRALFLTFISGISEPIGALLSYLFLKDYINELLISFILIFVSGLMISLSINDIYLEIKKYNKNKYIVIGLFISSLLCILLYYINK